MIMTPQSISDDKRVWVERLQRWGLGEIAPALIDALRPLGFIGSQAIVMAAPLLTAFVDASKLNDFAALLEDPERLAQLSRSFDAQPRSDPVDEAKR